MEIILLGTASATAGVDRDSTYFMMRFPDSSVLVDVGGIERTILVHLTDGEPYKQLINQLNPSVRE